MQVEFRLFRQIPPDPPRIQSFFLETSGHATILDCLIRIKEEIDGSLAFRKNCRNTICGSCAVRINGRAALACQKHVDQEISPSGITIAPLGNLPVMKDLIVDMHHFWDALNQVDPYVSSAARQIQEREFLQSPEERLRLNQVGHCILCGACYSECNAREVNAEFVGPHALAKVNRILLDSRDTQKGERLRQADTLAEVWGCTRCFNCNSVCPMDVAPLDQITQIKQQILGAQKGSVQSLSRAIRHRKTLVNLVREGGWIDERKFGLQVVANHGKDLGGLWSLAPLGLRMIKRGKFPFRFKASAGTANVRRLIDRVRAEESS
jgi:succinate dehydrogenase / fumarate reductase iron-sulfur subunit